MIENLKFNAHGLIPAIVQDAESKDVLMMAYMNEEAIRKTVETGKAWFYSRSRQKLWLKGESSGHVQNVQDIRYDCDADTVLLLVQSEGAACHEGYTSCFHYRLTDGQVEGEKQFEPEKVYQDNIHTVLHDVYNTIIDRKNNPKEGSYTCYLFEKGQDKILKKVGEECAETIIGSKNNDPAEIQYEMADLWYHCLVLLANHGMTPTQILEELAKRKK